ncbi:autoinducer 2-binding periplasmic protein LuxP [Litoribacillus peritrichatus]|uniref:Autoinducer 2-binding periplasmic protein LuxP n=2 Tax=Litoribacillus peritrichatus TaxID=718191 RepID=A0ABP7MKK8_9GAMM
MIDEYHEQYPEQRAISEAFNLRVQSQVEPIPTHPDAIKIMVVYPGLQVSDYWRRSVAALTKRLDLIGINYVLDSQFTKPGTDLNLQSKLIGNAFHDTPDYLIFTLDAIKHKKLIERVMSQGKTKIILQNITTPLKSFGNNQPFLYVGFDHATGTQLLVKEYQSRFPSGANYAILFGTQGYVSKIRGGVFESQMNATVNYQLRDSYYVNFNRNMAKEATLQLIQNHLENDEFKLDFIYAASTDIALGAIDALQQHDLKEQVIVNGWGGGSNELASIKNKVLDFTVMRMNDDNGVAMAEAIALDLSGRASQVPTIYSGSFRLIQQGIDPEQLQRFEKRAFRYSNETP